MSAPDKPRPPVLHGDDPRHPESLRVTWTDVDGATGYDVRWTDSSGRATEALNAGKPFTIPALRPATRYVVVVRGKNGDGVSPWSDGLTTWTRPEAPPAPGLVMDAMLPVFRARWEVTAPNDAYVSLRQVGGGTDQLALPNGPLTGRHIFNAVPSGRVWKIYLRVTYPQPELPGDINESPWSMAAELTTRETLMVNPALRGTIGKVPGLWRRR